LAWLSGCPGGAGGLRMLSKTGRAGFDFEDFRSGFFMRFQLFFPDGEDWDEC
jgi:hypothetical protein